MILIFDTETTGMVRWREPITHPEQPRVIQLGAALYHADGTELSAVSLIVRCDTAVEPEAAAVHGIEQHLIDGAGVKPKLAIYLLNEMASKADTLVAHNIAFDRKMAAIEFLRCEVDGGYFDCLPTFCTMQAATPLCRLLKQNPRHAADYKWPKLSEAYAYFFNEPLIGAHDALSDVRACARIYFHLQREHQNG